MVRVIGPIYDRGSAQINAHLGLGPSKDYACWRFWERPFLAHSLSYDCVGGVFDQNVLTIVNTPRARFYKTN